MICPQCTGGQTAVIDSRLASETVRRRRQCKSCRHRFTTFERAEQPPLVVAKKDGRREAFDRQKLLSGLERACEKRPISRAVIIALAETVETALRGRGKGEVTSREIGEVAMKSLANLDQVAYVRFASVYREFSDVTAFARVVEMLDQKK